MNRGDFILDTINRALIAEPAFNVVRSWSDNTKSTLDTVTLYAWIIDDQAQLFQMYEDGTIPKPEFIITRIGVKYSFTAMADATGARMTEIYNDTVAKIEYLLRNITLPLASTDDNYNSVTRITAVRVFENYGYYDDARTHGETSMLIGVYSKSEAT